jgi:hypothetical protein
MDQVVSVLYDVLEDLQLKRKELISMLLFPKSCGKTTGTKFVVRQQQDKMEGQEDVVHFIG